MTWINQKPASDPPNSLVVPAPRTVDAVGAALVAAYGQPTSLPADIRAPLRALDRIG